MGLLSDLSSLALAPLVQEVLPKGPPPGHASRGRWLVARLIADNGALLSALKEIVERAWEALEVILSTDALRQRGEAGADRTPERREALRLLAEVVSDFPDDPLLPTVRRRECALEVRALRSTPAVVVELAQTEVLADQIATA